MSKSTVLSKEQMTARIAELETLLAQKNAPKTLSLKVSEKGAVSVYGLQRFPVSLYQEQMTRLLDHAEPIRKFIADNKSTLKVKQQ